MRCIASLGDLQIFKKRKKVSVSSKLNVHNTLIKFASPAVSFFFRSLLLKLWVLLTLILDYFLKERFKTRRDNFCFKKRKKGKLKWIPTFLHCQEKRQHSNFFTDKQFWCLLLLLSPLSFKTGLWNMICAVTPLSFSLFDAFVDFHIFLQIEALTLFHSFLSSLFYLDKSF